MATFYLDHDVAHGIARLLREEGHEATTARSAGLQSAEDLEHLLRAAEQGQILVGHNRNDYNLLHGAWLHWSRAWGVTAEHAGILIIPQPRELPIARAARDLSGFVRSGRPLTHELYRRRPPGVRPGWERWRPGVGRAHRSAEGS